MLRQHLKNKFRAIQLSVPTAIAHFRVVHRNADGNLVDTRDYNIDLNSGRQSFSKVWFSRIFKAYIVLISYVFTRCPRIWWQILAQLLFDINGSVIQIKRVNYKEMNFKLSLDPFEKPSSLKIKRGFHYEVHFYFV